jgi:sporulation protein YlmC with PRC-barrel domain
MVLASALANLPVLSVDGREIGTVQNFRMDPRTGTLETLVVETNGGSIDELETDDDGDLLISASMIEGVDDQIMISLPR